MKMNKICLENKIVFPIHREDLICGELVNPTNTERRLVLLTYPKKEQFSNPEMKGHFEFKPFHKELAIDLNYITPQYELCTTNQKRNNIGYDYNSFVHLDFLLNYFDFAKELGPKEYLDCLNTLFNGKFPYENCQEFGYRWVGKSTCKNGHLIEDSQEKYNPAYYQKIPKIGYESPSLMPKYFQLLSRIDYKNPENAFKPLEEEGTIRKRTLDIR